MERIQFDAELFDAMLPKFTGFVYQMLAPRTVDQKFEFDWNPL